MDDPYLAAPDRYQRQAYRPAGRHGLLPGIGLGLWHNFGRGRSARVKAMVHPGVRSASPTSISRQQLRPAPGSPDHLRQAAQGQPGSPTGTS